MKLRRDDQEGIKDPFEVFGFGIMAYFDLLRYLMVIFVVICLLYVPVMVLYSKESYLS